MTDDRLLKALAKLKYAKQRCAKAHNIRICRRHIWYAKHTLGLSDKSPTLRYWRRVLSEWIACPDADVRNYIP